jgi:solute carrier family 25 (mitochondrial carnitine/acylcarnitine transporter), member 20/29
MSSPEAKEVEVEDSHQMASSSSLIFKTHHHHSYSLHEEALGGFAAGIVGTVLGFPLDLIKTRMQTSSHNPTAPQMGMVSMASHILQTEGIRSLYKGILPPLLSLSIVNTVSFTSYSFFRNLYGGQNGWDPINALAGMTGAPLFAMVTTPENFIKTQLQLDNLQGSRFRNSIHGASTLIQEFGIRVLYTGHVVNTIREGTFAGCYFFAYEGFRFMLVQSIHSFQKKPTTDTDTDTDTNTNTNNKSSSSVTNTIIIPMAGGMAGASAWFLSFPLDCIRAGVQGRQDLSPWTSKSMGAIQIGIELIKTKGIQGLYRGVGPSMARAFVVSGSRFSAYEGALWLLRGKREREHMSN